MRLRARLDAGRRRLPLHCLSLSNKLRARPSVHASPSRRITYTECLTALSRSPLCLWPSCCSSGAFTRLHKVVNHASIEHLQQPPFVLETLTTRNITNDHLDILVNHFCPDAADDDGQDDLPSFEPQDLMIAESMPQRQGSSVRARLESSRKKASPTQALLDLESAPGGASSPSSPAAAPTVVTAETSSSHGGKGGSPAPALAGLQQGMGSSTPSFRISGSSHALAGRSPGEAPSRSRARGGDDSSQRSRTTSRGQRHHLNGGAARASHRTAAGGGESSSWLAQAQERLAKRLAKGLLTVDAALEKAIHAEENLSLHLAGLRSGHHGNKQAAVMAAAVASPRPAAPSGRAPKLSLKERSGSTAAAFAALASLSSALYSTDSALVEEQDPEVIDADEAERERLDKLRRKSLLPALTGPGGGGAAAPMLRAAVFAGKLKRRAGITAAAAESAKREAKAAGGEEAGGSRQGAAPSPADASADQGEDGIEGHPLDRPPRSAAPLAAAASPGDPPWAIAAQHKKDDVLLAAPPSASSLLAVPQAPPGLRSSGPRGAQHHVWGAAAAAVAMPLRARAAAEPLELNVLIWARRAIRRMVLSTIRPPLSTLSRESKIELLLLFAEAQFRLEPQHWPALKQKKNNVGQVCVLRTALSPTDRVLTEIREGAGTLLCGHFAVDCWCVSSWWRCTVPLYRCN